MEENIKRKDLDKIRPKNNFQWKWKWQWLKDFYFLKYTRTKEYPQSVCKTRLCVYVCGKKWNARYAEIIHSKRLLHVYTRIECGVLATIEQWYPTREFFRLGTIEKTIKYPISAMCQVCVYVCGNK